MKPVDVVECGSFDWSASGVLLSPPGLHLQVRMIVMMETTKPTVRNELEKYEYNLTYMRK